MNGFGLTTFTYAILIRSIIGLPIIYYIQPWKVGFSLDFHIFKKLVTLGSPFQANSILALIKDDLLNLYVASILPLTQMGYIGFGQKWAFQPLRLFMDNVIKVIFPALSRLQHDAEALKSLIEKSLFLISFFIFPIVAGFILFAPYAIAFIPKYQKWEPALISLSFFSLNALFASISVPLTNFLNAVGKVNTTLRFMVFWTVLIWILTPVCIYWFGYNGVSLASAIVAGSVLLILIPVKKTLQFSFLRPIWKQAVATVCMVVIALLLNVFISSVGMLLLVMGISAIGYFAVLLILGKQELLQTYRFMKENMKR
jgi:O-antigen/teichoic acid export membrane protein